MREFEFWRHSPIAEEIDTNSGLNKDQTKGAAKGVGGKIQEEAGKLAGSKEQQAKGLGKQVEGKMQEQGGNLKAAVTDATMT